MIKKGIDNRTIQQKRADYCIDNNIVEENDILELGGRKSVDEMSISHNIAPTLKTRLDLLGKATKEAEEMPLRIRKLTPRECWRLMGRTDDDFEKAERVCSNSQLYKQAGNSIVVDVLVYLFGELFRQYPTERNENG